MNTYFEEEGGDAGEEVREGLVGDDTLGYRVTEGHRADSGLPRRLGVFIEEGEFDVFDFGETGVGFIIWIDEVLDLCHCELAHAEQACAGGDLVTEGATDLGRGEGDLAVVEVEEAGEVGEVPLGGLGAEEAGVLACGADGGGEHEVERDGGGDGVGGVGVGDGVFGEEVAELGAGVVV